MSEPPKAARTPRSVKAQPRIPGAMSVLAAGFKIKQIEAGGVPGFRLYWNLSRNPKCLLLQVIERFLAENHQKTSKRRSWPREGSQIKCGGPISSSDSTSFNLQRSLQHPEIPSPVAAAQGTDDGQQEHIHLSLKTTSHTSYRSMAPYSS